MGPKLDSSRSGVGKRGLLGKGLSIMSFLHFLEVLQNLEILERFQSVENKGECDLLLGNSEIVEIPDLSGHYSREWSE